MKRNTIIIISVLAVFLLSGLGVGLYFIFKSENDSNGGGQSVLGSSATAIATKECAEASVDILQKGGSAVDAAVTAALCQGVTVPQSSGLGGGLIATIYIRKTMTIETINAREVAPLASYKDMYPDNISSREGGLAVAVPTELKGLHEMHKKYGKLPWSELVNPVAEIAENGFEVTRYLEGVFVERADKINSYPEFK
jgi:gamma-glutamyltranspeptidase / glutathione hydrolase / leukotriene-C4 hydrolase